MQRLGILFRSYICFKRSTGLHAATAVLARLQEGYRVFCDEGGKLQLHQLKKMVSASRSFILIMSQDVLAAHWAMAELRRAIASYVALQAEHSAALRDQWAELLPDLDAGAPLPPPPAEEAVGV